MASVIVGGRPWGRTILIWLALWATINSGPWNLVSPSGVVGWINATRAAAPLAILVVWVLLLPGRSRGVRLPTGPETLWILYALVSLVAVLGYDRWAHIAYWGLAYLSVFAAIDLTLRDAPLSRAADMVWINWTLATLALLAMLFVARDVLFVKTALGVSAYNVDMRAATVAGAPISKTSGLARLAIVPAVVSFVLMVKGKPVIRAISSVVLLITVLLIWVFQTRQGIFGMAFALCAAMLFMGGRARALGIAGAGVVAILLYVGAFPEDVVRQASDYATRGEGSKAFESMTGRTHLWRLGWRAVEGSPLFGYGPQADRHILGLNISNGLLYAALCGGYLGAALYVGGIAWGWLLLYRALRHGYARTDAERLFLVQVGGVMAYLTMRNIPENTGALFSVDLLLHGTMLAYLGSLERERGSRATRAPLPLGLPQGAKVRVRSAGMR